MSTLHLNYNVRHVEGLPVIDLQGQLDAMAGDALDNAYEQAHCSYTHSILLNFSDVEYINSTGIAIIIGLIMQASKAGCRLLACGLNAHYQKIFEMARLADYIGIFANEADALASVQNAGFQI